MFGHAPCSLSCQDEVPDRDPSITFNHGTPASFRGTDARTASIMTTIATRARRGMRQQWSC